MYSRYLFALSILALTIFTQCQCDKSKTEGEPIIMPLEDAKTIQNDNLWNERRFELDKKRMLILQTAKQQNNGLIQTQLITNGFANDEIVDFGQIPEVDDVYVSDLNGDGFQELYFYAKKTDAEQAQFFGVTTSANGMRMIEVEKRESIEQKAPDAFKGFKGYDHYKLSNKDVFHVFPVHLPNDKVGQPTGGSQVLIFKLKDNKLVFERILP